MDTLEGIRRVAPHGFAAVDDHPHPEQLVRFLDEASAQASVRAYKNASIALMRLDGGQRALDVGCGLGDDLLRLASLVGAEGLVVGVDSSQVMLDHARRRTEGAGAPIELRTGTAYALGLADASFDAVRADRLLHFLEAPEAALAELIRVVRRGGRVVVSEPDYDTIAIDTSEPELTARLLDYRRRDGALRMPGRRLRRLFVDAGLEDIEATAHTGLVTDFLVAERMLSMTSSLRTTIRAGALTVAEALRWRAAASRDSQQGRFLLAMTVFTVGGTRANAGQGAIPVT
jgi:SAM-dependent methyltransferase